MSVPRWREGSSVPPAEGSPPARGLFRGRFGGRYLSSPGYFQYSLRSSGRYRADQSRRAPWGPLDRWKKLEVTPAGASPSAPIAGNSPPGGMGGGRHPNTTGPPASRLEWPRPGLLDRDRVSANPAAGRRVASHIHSGTRQGVVGGGERHARPATGSRGCQQSPKEMDATRAAIWLVGAEKVRSESWSSRATRDSKGHGGGDPSSPS
jgi:hypothetical protein